VVLDYGNNGVNDNKQGSPDVIAFKSNGTWHIKANFQTAELLLPMLRPVRNYNNFTVDLYLMAYKRLITKHNINEINADDLGGTNGSAKRLINHQVFNISTFHYKKTRLLKTIVWFVI
jgi:hypothetical protein